MFFSSLKEICNKQKNNIENSSVLKNSCKKKRSKNGNKIKFKVPPILDQESNAIIDKSIIKQPESNGNIIIFVFYFNNMIMLFYKYKGLLN